MTKFVKGALLFVVAVLFLSACSANLKEEQKATHEKVEAAFNSAPKKTNKENNDIRFNLPFGYEIEETSENNVLLKNGAKTYILFYNQQEGPDSEIVYNATLETKHKFNYNKTFKKDDLFGYLLIRDAEDDDKLQEVTVGIGGVKITTNSKIKSMKTAAETMMKIVQSVEMINKDEEK